MTLVGLTAVFAATTTLLRRRSLTATAEAVAAVTVMLGLGDAYAVRVGAFPASDVFVFWAGAGAVLALVAAAFARWSGAAVPRLAAALLIQLPAPLLAANRSSSQTVLLGVLLLQALATVGVLRRAPVTDPRVTAVLRAGGGLAWIIGAAGAASLALAEPSQRPVAAVLLLMAGLGAAAVAWLWSEEEDLSLIASGVAGAVLLAAASTLAARWLDGDALALGIVGFAVAVAGIAARIDRRWSRGPVAVASVVAIGASAPSWPALGAALRAPWWAGSQFGAWTVAAGRSARAVGNADVVATGPGVALCYLGLLAVGAVGARRRLGRVTSDWALALLAGVAVSTVPFAADAAVWSATVIVLAAGVLVTALVLWRVAAGDPDDELLPWWTLAVGLAVQGLAWALLTPGLTLLALLTIAATAAIAVLVTARRGSIAMAQGAAAVMALTGAASVPVIARMVDASPAVGWTALSVLAAGLVTWCFAVWARSSPADHRRPSVVIAATVGWVAGAAYAVGAVGAGSQFDHAAVPGLLAGIFGAGSVAAWLIVMPSIRRPLVMVPGVAAMSGTLLGLAAVGMVTVQAGLSPPATWTVVILASATVTLAGLLIEASSLPADVVWAVDASAAVGGFVALTGLVSVGSADQISVGLLVVTMGFAVEALRQSRRAAAWGAALGALVLVWQRLAMAGVTTAEAYTLPAAAFLAVIAVWRDRHSPDESSWTTWGPALVVALGPSVLLAIRDPGVLRPVSTVIAAAVVTLLGARWQRRAPVMIGAAALVALGVQQLAPIVRQLPRWITFAVVGMLLLLVGASYERRRAQLAGLRTHYRRLH